MKRKCGICGATNEEKIVKWVSAANCYLCSKHKAQFYRNGKITDPTKRTTVDKNEYIIKEDHAEIIIRNNRQQIIATALIDIDDVEKCMPIKWSMSQKHYVRCRHKNISLHRFIMDYDGPLQIDHINRNRLDNRKSNLRIVSIFVNAQNNGKEGVSFDKKTNKWRAEFNRYGKYFYVGSYKTKEEALIARNNKITEIDNDKNIYLMNYLNKSKNHYTGVRPSPHGRWMAKFWADGKVHHVGTYDTEEEAFNARNIAINEYKKKKLSA